MLVGSLSPFGSPLCSCDMPQAARLRGTPLFVGQELLCGLKMKEIWFWKVFGARMIVLYSPLRT